MTVSSVSIYRSAINFALSLREDDRCRFLRAFLKGNTKHWPQFQPRLNSKSTSIVLRIARDAADHAVEKNVNTAGLDKELA